MTINRSSNKAEEALVKELAQLKRDFYEFKTNPQPIGNGSMNYAVFTPAWALGPITVGAGGKQTTTIVYLVTGVDVTYEGKLAINRYTLMDSFYSLAVDTNDANHTFPYGSS